MVLHCSAGLGRTGVFATVHSSLECHLDGRLVDIQRTVAGLRRQRQGMVQTQEQYRYSYESIAEALLPAEQDQELSQQFDAARPLSYPPPPYKEKESREGSPTHDSTSPPPPPTSPLPPLSEPATPVKAAIPETPPITTPPPESDTNSLKKRPLSEASITTTPSRPVSGEGEAVRRKVLDKMATSAAQQEVGMSKQKVPATSQQEVAVEIESEPKSKANVKPKTEIKKTEQGSRRKSADTSNIVIPQVMVTAPSSEQLDKVGLSDAEASIEETTPPTPPTSPPPDSPSVAGDEPPPPPTSPPPEEEEEKEEEEAMGFAIGDDQVIEEKPYSKADAKPPSAAPTGLSSKPKWTHKPAKTTPTSSASKPLPIWKQEMQRRKEEAAKKESPGKVTIPQFSTPAHAEPNRTVPGRVSTDVKQITSEPASPRRVGKINIPSVFGGGSGDHTPDTPTRTPPQRPQASSQRVELAKSSGTHPTPPSSPAVARKWGTSSSSSSPARKWGVKTETPPKEEEEKETGTTPPALRRLKQLQRRGTQSSGSPAPVYKLPALSSPGKSGSQDTTTGGTQSGSGSSTHSADTGSGNVARLLARFQ